MSWDFASDSWTSEGCMRTTTSQTAQSGVITCECNHLTNFAVLVVSQLQDSLEVIVIIVAGALRVKI